MVEKFTYLGSILSKSIVMDDEVNTRLAKTSAAFGLLSRNVWNQRDISEATKIKVYQAVILTILLYGCETWSTYQRHIKKLNHFHTTSLRKIFGITWWKHIPDTKVLPRTSLPSIYSILIQSQLCWAGHVVCMKDHCLLKKLLHGKLFKCKCSQGGQKKHFKDTLKVSMKSFGITPNCLEYLVQERDKWREVVKRGAKVCETRRNAPTELCRKFRKGTATSATTATIPCYHCPGLFHAQISLISHLRTHGSHPQSKGWSDGPHRLQWIKMKQKFSL